MFIRLLQWIGFVRIVSHLKIVDGAVVREPPRVRWPFHWSPWWIWKILFINGLRWLLRRPNYSSMLGGWFGFFRNRPGVVKWEKGRLLPRRWGFYIIGFELGDRG